jgi:hypothetical protein
MSYRSLDINRRFGEKHLLQFQGRRAGQARNYHEDCSQFSFTSDLPFNPENRSSMFLRHVALLSTDYKVLHRRRQNSQIYIYIYITRFMKQKTKNKRTLLGCDAVWIFLEPTFRRNGIRELGTLAVTTNWSTLRRNTLTRATRRHIPKDGILHNHCRENHKSYKSLRKLSELMRNEQFSKHVVICTGRQLMRGYWNLWDYNGRVMRPGWGDKKCT